MSPTATKGFGSGKREGHDASVFYGRGLYAPGDAAPPDSEPGEVSFDRPLYRTAPPGPALKPEQVRGGARDWANRVFCASSEHMAEVPDNSIGLAFTSPPYNVGKEYEGDLSVREYLELLQRVAREVHRVLMPGGRYVFNVANLGRKPYIPLHAWSYDLHMAAGFLPMGEIIWVKASGAAGNCAWGSWRSARSPRLRDLHEYLLVFAKEAFSRPDRGVSDIGADEFMEATLSVWRIAPESARRVGHPAPFPAELAERVIKLYSYAGDVVLDPFAGSGTTCVAAAGLGRDYVGYEISPAYCHVAEARLGAAGPLAERVAKAPPRKGRQGSPRAKANDPAGGGEGSSSGEGVPFSSPAAGPGRLTEAEPGTGSQQDQLELPMGDRGKLP